MSTASEPTGDEAELLRRARSGDDGALESLYTRYVDSARALARRLVGADAADDLVAEAFARVVAQIKAGRGPTSNFRAYLCTTMRNRHADIAPVLQHEQPASDRPWLLDGTESPLEEALASFDDDEAVAALSSLPHSWRQVLWHLEIEGHRVPEVAHLLGTTPAAVSSLAYRAREGLKAAYLAQVAAANNVGGQCGWVRERLSQFVRGKVGQRAAGKIDSHVPRCASCSGALAQMQQVNSKLAALVVPILLVGVVKGVKGGLVLGGATATSGGVASLLHGPRPLKPTTAVTVGAAAAAAAAVAIAATGLFDPGDPTAPTEPPPAASRAGGNNGAAPNASAPATGRQPAPDAEDDTIEAEDEAEDEAEWGPGGGTTLGSTPITAPPAPSPTPDPDSTPTPKSKPTATPTRSPDPVAVTPAAPTAEPITDCGTDGSLRVPTTTGLRYVVTTGNGREGAWVVQAHPRPGYAIVPDATTSWRGDLGARYRCPYIEEATTTRSDARGGAERAASSGRGLRGGVTVDVAAFGNPEQLLELRIELDHALGFVSHPGEGEDDWSCVLEYAAGVPIPLDAGLSAGLLVPGVSWVTCEHTYTGEDPSPVTLRTTALGSLAGTAVLTADGVERDTAAF